jgi:hypothetical protein
MDALELDALGRVRWWSAANQVVSLHQILVHVTTETHRHAGHADIVRELVDGSVGLRQKNSNLPSGDRGWWAGYHDRLEETARAFRDDPIGR